MKYEVEQKYPLEDVTGVRGQLEALGATFGAPQVQADRYFAHPARDFAETDEALRIRSVGDSNCVTYKGPKIDQTTKTRREIELPLPDGQERSQEYEELFNVLGFPSVTTVSKVRQTAEIQWHHHSLTIALDEVQGLGDYLELEIVTEDAGLDAARDALADLASHLQLTSIERRSYLQLLLESGVAKDERKAFQG